MKSTILSVLSMTLALVALSQSDITQGSVIYEEVLKIDIQMDNMTSEMQAMLPKENRNSTILYFNEEASRYENLDQTDDAVIDQESEGGGVMVMISQPENIMYRDLKNETTTEQTEFMTRVFLIKSDYLKDEWKLTGNQKMILNYPCQEAFKHEGEDTVSVWFTPAIPVPTGPGKYANLPGLVLAVEANHGDMTIIAKSVDFKEIDPEKIRKPKKGKKVTMEEYMAIVEEKTKEMGGNGEAQGTHTVIMKVSQ